MPNRYEPFIIGNIYHVFNKTIDHKRVFQSEKYVQEFYNRLIYYRSTDVAKSYSDIVRLKQEIQDQIFSEILIKSSFQVRVLSYVFMPTHYHFLLEQIKDNGIVNFISKVTNSFTRYFNLKNQRKGQLFLNPFKAVLVRTDEQLIHTSRYINLNPFLSGIIDNIDDLKNYKMSSFPSLIGKKKDTLVSTDKILGYFDSKEEYKDFVVDRAEVQRQLEELKHINEFIQD